VNRPLARRAGSALLWQAVQHLGAKLIYLARIPILARLLAPDDFGLMAIAIIAVEFLMHATNFGFIPALVQRETIEDRHYHAAWTAGLLRAGCVSLVVFLAAPWIAQLFEEPRTVNIIRLLALRPLLQAAVSIRVADLTRQLAFRKLAVLSLSEALAAAVLSISLAPAFGVWGLAVGALSGPTLHALLSYRMAPYRPRLRFDREATQALIRFGRWVYAVGLIALLARSVIHAVISRQLGAADLGLYFLAGKLAFLPSDIATELVGKVAFPLFSRLQSNLEQAARAFRALVMAQAVLLFPALGLILALAPTLVTHVLGPRWEGSAPVVRVLAVACLAGLFLETATPIFNGLGRPKYVAIVETVQSAGILASVALLTSRYGLTGAAASWIPATVAAQLLGWWLLRRLIARPLRGLFVPLTCVMLCSALGAVYAWSVDRQLQGWSGLLLAAIPALLLSYGLLLLIGRRVDLGLAEAVSAGWPGATRWLDRLGLARSRAES